jgi:hypothetical protein
MTNAATTTPTAVPTQSPVLETVKTPTAIETTAASPTTTTTTTITPAPKPTKSTTTVPNHEPRTEIKDGVEWVSFVYSHHRVLRRYSIRTDVDQVDINILDDKFKNENCVNMLPSLIFSNLLTS